METQYLNDHWTNEIHYLHYESFALQVRDLILTAPTPFALSIGGRWGMGKTSTLRALIEALGGESEKSGIAKQSISAIENGHRNVNYDQKLIDCLL